MKDRRDAMKSRARNQAGVAVIEFALVATVFFGIVFAALDFGYAFMTKENMTHAAQEGMRAAVVYGSDANGQSAAAITNAASRLSSFGGASGLTAPAAGTNPYCGSSTSGQLTICTNVVSNAFPACSGGSSGTCMTLTVTYDYKDNSILGPLDLIPGWGHLIHSTLNVTATQRMTAS
jgi:Flp pilus assembly protein TadG